MTNSNKNSLSDFTNLYSISKTLRFELKPVGENGKVITNVSDYIKYIKKNDEEIEEAYQALKPELDKIHEKIINDSLNSDLAKEIKFSAYIKEYEKGKEKKLGDFEKELREDIGKTFEYVANNFKKEVGMDEKGKHILKNDGTACLAENGILKYLDKKLTEEKLKDHLSKIKSFWTYFDNYNTNRANYYVFTEEASTAVASRIVSDNLPKFCDNIISFKKRKDEYENAYQFLKDNNKNMQIKDAESGLMIEAVAINADLFRIEHFNSCIYQSGIEDYNKKIGHYNLLINLYNQAKKEEKDFNKLKHFKILYKQIGCGKRKALFFELKYDNKEEQDKKEPTKKNEILNLKDLLFKIKTNSRDFIEKVNKFTEWLKERKRKNDWSGIYWSKTAVDKISNKYLENYHSLKDELKKNKACVNKNNRTKEWEFNDAVELSGLFDVNLEFKGSVKEEHNKDELNLIDLICEDIDKNLEDFKEKIDSILKITNYKEDNEKKEIKDCLDFILNVIHSIKYFSVKENKVKGEPIDSELSNYLENLLKNEDFAIIKWYDTIRNYLTKKPQDDVKKQKLKLNFGKSNLLDGFVDSYSLSNNGTQYGGYIFRKKNVNNEYEYFLGISKYAKLFRCHKKKEIKDENKSEYERLDYYQAKSTTYFDNKYSYNKEKLIKKIEELLDNVKENEDNKKEKIKIKKRNKKGEITPSALFDRLKKSKIKEFKDILQNKELNKIATETVSQLQEYCKKFENNSDKLKILVNDKTEYIGIKGFKQIILSLLEIAKENKIFHFFNIDKNELKKSLESEENDKNESKKSLKSKENDKKMYLFKISNKDLKERDLELENIRKDYKGEKRKYNDNLHTLYFKALMREIDNSRIDIGAGEIFFRKAMGEKKEHPTHPKNVAIKRRKDGKFESEFKHDIIKDNRFFEDKLQLHLSIKINYNPSDDKVDDIVNDELSKKDDVLFLGIDRGEKNLIYYSLINQKGEIIKQDHFNTINGKDYYSAILEKIDKKKKAQQNWGEIGEIKNIKDGYISLVIHEIVKLIKDKLTFIVLEDLNAGFKRGRFCFEQQVYQKFELALAKKLNYLVYKDAIQGEIGSEINGLQLTPPVNNYQNIENKKQLGIMLYVRANYTSVTDPATGWRKTIYLKKGKEEDIKKQILDKFSEIGFDGKDYFFEYTEKHANKKWTLWSGKDGKSLERFRRGKDKIIEQFNIKDMLDELFKDFDKSKSLKDQLQTKDPAKIEEHTALESLRFVIDLIMQIRNNGDKDKNQDENFLLSPVRNEHGKHFDSRDYKKQSNPEQPKDADANGAFNIARKGLIAFKHVKQWIELGKPKFKNEDNKETADLDLFISDEEWDLWLLKHEEWENRLLEFSSRKKKEKEK